MKDASDEYHLRKHDADKPRPALIPGSVLLEVGKVMAYGAKKYAAHSWQTIPDAKERYLDAMMRHYCAMVEGETHDAESGLLHAAHMACNAIFLCWFALREAADEAPGNG